MRLSKAVNLLKVCIFSGLIFNNPSYSAEIDNVVLRTEERLLRSDYADFRKLQISNPAYALQLELDKDSNFFKGTVEISFSLAAENVSPLTIDFDNGTITSLSINGENAQYNYEQWFISIAPTVLKPGNNTIQISYERPYASDGAGLHKFIDPENGEVYLYTNFEPYDANRLFPHFDQPNLKAPLSLEVTAPIQWHVIANTREESTSDKGDLRHWKFPASAPISSYVYAMHAGPYHMWEDQAGNIPLRLFSRNAVADYVITDEWFKPTQESFSFFQEYFDIDYPFGKYDQIIVPDFNAGAMENVGAVTFSERYLSRGVRSTAQKRNIASVIAHEMAHMWFGDLVTMDWWNGLWLNESFATYMSYLALENANNFGNVWDSFYTGMKQSAYRADQLITTHPIELEVLTTTDAFTNFDGITYGKGGSVLRQLPFYIGAENFRQGVSNYLKRYSYSNTTLDNFVDELASASNMDLEQWKQEWLYKSGVNTIRIEFSCNNSKLSKLTLHQSAPQLSSADKTLRSQRTQLGFYRYENAKMQNVSNLPVNYTGATTEVTDLQNLPCPDLVLPNEGDWAYMKIALDAKSLANARKHINAIANPTTRLMLWQSLWDSVLDSELSMDEYVSFTLANAGSEMDETVLRYITGNLSSAYSYLATFGQQQTLQENIETFIRTQLSTSEPGSEAQLIWLDNLMGRTSSFEGLNYLGSLLNGDTTLELLPIDQDRRWSIVRTLNRYQHGNYNALLAAEKERDPSDQGVNNALAAEAIRPDAAIKNQWLDIIINEPDTYKLATLRTIMAVLYPPEQNVLAQASAERLLSIIPTLNAQASQEFLGEFTGYFSTATCSEESVARLEQANVDFKDLQPLVVKSFLIHHQDDARCLSMKKLME